MILIFWIFLFVVFYTYIGYGVVLYLLVKCKEAIRGKLKRTDEWESLPEMTLVIAAYNEEDVVEAKMENCRSLKYPKGRLTILWVTDGSSDSTNEKLAEYDDAEVSYQPERRGKTAAINRAIVGITTPIVVFTDANTTLNEDALVRIGSAFSDSKVGCVAGEKRVMSEESDSASSSGEGAYWKYESKLKEWDYRLHSTVGAAGELFAIRRELYKSVSDDTLLDDFIISLEIVMQGYIIAYCSDAYAMESGSANIANEKKRKVRIAAGGLQSIWRLRALLNPFKYGVFCFQYISHRVLRWTITPVMLFSLIPLNIAIVLMGRGAIYQLLFVAQILFYIIALWGYAMQDREIKRKILFLPMYFVFMNLNPFYGVQYLLNNKGKGAWEKAKRK